MCVCVCVCVCEREREREREMNDENSAHARKQVMQTHRKIATHLADVDEFEALEAPGREAADNSALLLSSSSIKLSSARMRMTRL